MPMPSSKNLLAQRCTVPAKKRSKRRSPASGLTFNHAMVYSKDVSAALRFYAEQLGLKIVENFQHQDNTTIALHQVAPGDELHTGGVRLYFEVKNLDRFCDRLESAGLQFSQKPKEMPWGWKHAYLNDPDGHEVSLYWAGAKRLRSAH